MYIILEDKDKTPEDELLKYGYPDVGVKFENSCSNTKLESKTLEILEQTDDNILVFIDMPVDNKAARDIYKDLCNRR